MAGKSAKVKKPEEKANLESRIEASVNQLAPHLEKTERVALRDIIGDQKEDWREGTGVYFPEEYKQKFIELRDLLRKAGYNAKISSDKDGWALFLGSEAERVTDTSAAKPPAFKAPRPEAPAEKAPKEKKPMPGMSERDQKLFEESQKRLEAGRRKQEAKKEAREALERKRKAEAEPQMLSNRLKKTAGKGGEGIAGRLKQLEMWREAKDASEKRLARLKKKIPIAKRKQRKRQIALEEEKLKRLKDNIKLVEQDLRQFRTDYRRLLEITSETGEAQKGLKPYMISAYMPKVEEALAMKPGVSPAEKYIKEEAKPPAPAPRPPAEVAKKPEPAEKIGGVREEIAQKVEEMAEEKPAPVPAKGKKPPVKDAFNAWRYAEFERRYGVTYESIKGEYDRQKAEYEGAYADLKKGKLKEAAARTVAIQAMANLVENTNTMYKRLSSKEFKLAFRKWARKEYGAGTKQYKEAVKAYTSLLIDIKRVSRNNSKQLKQERRQMAAFAKKAAEAKKVQEKRLGFNTWRNDFFEKNYGERWDESNRRFLGYDVGLTSLKHDLALGSDESGQRVTKEIYLERRAELIENKVEHLVDYHGKLSSRAYRNAFLKWAKERYGKGTKGYREAVSRYRKTLRIVKRNAVLLKIDARKARTELAALTKKDEKAPVTFDEILKWAGTNEASLEYVNRPENQEAIKAMLRYVPRPELTEFLERLDETALSLMKMEAPPGAVVRVPVSGAKKAEEFEAVKKGLSLLYAARGLKEPEFTAPITAQRQDWKGMKVLRVTSKPELYVAPEVKNIFPAPDKNGYVFVQHKGKRVFLLAGQAALLEKALVNGETAITDVIKYNPKRGPKTTDRVDTSGAWLLADYLKSRGFTNVATQPWSGGPANAGIRVEEVPNGHWDRPTPEKMGVLEKKRARMEEDIFLAIEETSIPRNGRIEGYGPVLDDLLDAAQYQAYYSKLSPEEKKYVDENYLTSPEKLLSQRNQLEQIANTPIAEGTNTAVFFHKKSRATNAADWLQSVLEAKGYSDVVVFVDDQPPFKRLSKTFGGYWLKVRKRSTNAFGERDAVPIRVPREHGKEPLLKSSEERSRLETFLNGPIGKKTTFYLTAGQAAVLEDYLASINFDPNASEYVGTKVSNVPAASREDFEGPPLFMKGSDRVYKVTLTMPEMAPLPALDPKLKASRHIQLTEQLAPLPIKNKARILRDAKHGGPSKDEVYTIEDPENAKKLYLALRASQLVSAEYDGKNMVVIRQRVSRKPPKAEKMIGKRKKVLKERQEELKAMRGVFVLSQNMNEQQRKLAEDAVRRENPKADKNTPIEFEFGVAADPASVREAFAEGQGEGERAYSALFSAAVYLNHAFWRGPKLDFLNADIANGVLEFKNLKKDKNGKFVPFFSTDISKKTMQYFALMHSGPGKAATKGIENVYAMKMGRMYNELSQYKDFAEFAKHLDVYALTGVMHGANLLTEDMIARNTEYDSWSPQKQAMYKSAVFDTMWRTIVAVMVYESGGPVPNARPPANYKKFQAEYGKALTDWLSGRGEYNVFTDDKGNKYRVYDRIIVTQDGDRLLTVPIPNDPDHVMAVKKLVRPKTEPEGFTYFVYEDLKEYEKQVYSVDSLGPVGATPKFRIGTFPTTIEIRIEKKVPKTIELPAAVSIYPHPEAKAWHGAEWWVRSWEEDDMIIGMRPDQATLNKLFDQGHLKNERVQSVTYVRKTVGKGRNAQPYLLILPPKWHYDEKGTKVDVDYPRGLYASAYADRNGDLYVFRYIDKEKREEHPINAREDNYKYMKMSDKQLEAEGIERVDIGSCNLTTGEIVISDKHKKEYEKHIVGNWLLNKDNMVQVGEKELDDFSKRVPGFYHRKGASYYRVRGFEAGVPFAIAAGRGEKGNLYLTTTIPDRIETKKKKKVKLKSR